MLSLANVCAGGRYLVIDETGLLVAAILERGTVDISLILTLGASVFVLHENQEPYLDSLKFFPHLQQYFRLDPYPSDSQEPTFHSMDFLQAFHPSSIILTLPQPSPMYERKLRTYNRELQVHKTWNEGGFDGFISVSSYDPHSYLSRCIERIEMCSNIVVYSPFRETIVELQNFVLTKMPTRPILGPIIHEIRAPRWSTLKGRVRPDMLGRGGGGWILSGVRVEEGDIEMKDDDERKKKRKVTENGTEVEDVKTDSAVETE